MNTDSHMAASINDRDHAGNSGGMPLHQLERVLDDVENEPKWRASSDKCADYYDHKQSSPERVARHAETGEPMTTINLIQRTINGALGQEAKTRLNWRVTPDSDSFADVAVVLNQKLHEAQREARTDMAISEAYASMLKTGIGWVMVDKDPNPLKYPYRVRGVHRNDVWWDWRAREADLSDAQWMLMQRWADLDEVVTLMPQHRNLLEIGTNSGPITDAMMRTIAVSEGQFEDIHRTRSSYSRRQEEWLDNSVRRRVRLYSVFYKQHKKVIALVAGTKRIRFNPQNPYHVAAVQRGAAQLMAGPGYVMRRAMFAGPFRLYDEELPGQTFPLIPFICYRCDDDFSPYGLVHGMIEPQDEFNERRSRLLWLLKAKQVFVDNDALDETYNNLADLAKEVMRPDAMFVMNPNRRNVNGGLRVEMNPALGAEQANVMNDAKILIQDQPGLYGPQFGGNRIGAESGLALNSLLEQSIASLGETSDNYRTSRQMVGDAVVQNIADDHKAENMRVMVGSGKKRRIVVLNGKDENGLPVNPIEDAQVKVGLGDVPTTTAYKAQQQVFLKDALMATQNNPLAQAVLVPALLESGDLEHRSEYAKWMRKQSGIPDPTEMGEEDEQADMAAMQQKQQAAQLQAAAAEAKVVRDQSAAEQSKSAAVLNIAKAEQISFETQMKPMELQASNEDLILQRVLEQAAA